MSSDKAYDHCEILSKGAFDPDADFTDDIAANEPIEPIELGTEIPVIKTVPHELEVYGFESSLWEKLRGYIGF